MGFNCGNLVLLAEYSKRNNLGSVLTYGRLFSTLAAKDRRKIISCYGLPEPTLAEHETEGLFAELGAERLLSLDISGHERCDLIADLTDDFTNHETMRSYLGSFDTVIDYGTSEHVFMSPQALVNAYNLLSDGGVYIFDLPVSGWLSHGLYQFTPSYFLSIGSTPYFDLKYYFFHMKRTDNIYKISHYNHLSYFLINGRRRISAWGVLRKGETRKEEQILSLNDLKIQQVDARDLNEPRKVSLIGKILSIKRYSAKTVHRGFDVY